MTNEYWKKRAKELEQQHHQPAHVTQNKSLDQYLDNVPGLPGLPSMPTGTPNQNNRELDIGAALAQRIAAAVQSQQGMGPQAPMAQNSPNVVFIKEGVSVYRQLEAQGYGSNMPIVRAAGPIEGVNGRQFEFKGIVEAYVLNNDGPVDLANVNPSQLKRLAVVQAPFIGKILLPENAVIQNTKNTKVLLND